jgi:hypothetical protein
MSVPENLMASRSEELSNVTICELVTAMSFKSPFPTLRKGELRPSISRVDFSAV